MVNSCCAIGCTSRYAKGAGISFHAFPYDDDRKALWVRALKRKNWKPSRYSVICGKHFQTGKPNHDEGHPDFVPNVFTFSKGKVRSAEKYEMHQKRHERILSVRETNKVVKENCEAASSLHSQDVVPDNTDQQDSILSVRETNKVMKENCEAASSLNSQDIVPDNAEQQDICQCASKTVANLMEENKKLKEEIAHLKSQKVIVDSALEMNHLKEEIKLLKDKLDLADFSTFLLREKKQLIYYTGVPDIGAFRWILSTTIKFIDNTFSVPAEQQLLMVLIKLRLALHDQDIAVRFKTSRRTVGRILEAWLPILAGRLRHLIFWPSRDQIKKHLPTCFKNSIYNDTICIIDCTEIPTQRPSNLKTKNQMWSNYKQHLTVKFLVAITPQGHICFLSDCWGGRVSDKELTLKSNILTHFKSGDIVLADRGFNVASHFQLEGVKLIVPTYTKGKQQLSHEEVLKSKRISNVRIHVERAIGYLKKFKILNNVLPITSLKYLDSIIKICAAIYNLWPPTVV